MWANFATAGWIFVPFVGLGCIAWGYYALVKWIPNSANEEKVRTDFYSARASYYMICAGLLILVLWAFSLVGIGAVAIVEALCMK